ncbi:hypothetical protein GF366_00855 [Candidatus Peregrinibacteria bacterium]|nr:hypothetical protein [Candidatus Peregrinibacteria bacterium]
MKKSFKLSFLVLITAFFTAGCDSTEKSPEEICREGGGEWKEMPDACVDSCESQRDGIMCAQVITEGCDCGEGRCWNGKSCEPL